MKKIFISGFWILYFLVGSAQQNRLSLQQCIEIGSVNNLDVLQSDLQTQADEVRWKQAKLNRLPDLNASGNYAFNAGRSIDQFTNTYITDNNQSSFFSLGSGVTIFNGFSM